MQGLLWSGWRDFEPRPLDPQAGSGGFRDLAIRRVLAFDLGFCCLLTFIVLQPFSFSRGLLADSWIERCLGL